MKRIVFPILLLALLAGGCEATVYKQAIPISTAPMGATILVDGQPAGVTPTSVDLPRNQDHILTITKDGYRQEDVTVKRVYQAESSMLSAISKGVNDANFFKNDSMGFQSGVADLETQKATGEAYVLSPRTVKINLVPIGGLAAAVSAQHAATKSNAQSNAAPAPQPSAAQGPEDVSAILTAFDHEMLDRVLETSKSGEPTQWTSPDNNWTFVVTPEPAQMMDGFPVRTFKIIATRGSEHHAGKYPAYRENSNDWRIGYPHQVASGSPDMERVNDRALLFGALKAASAGAKPIGGDTKLGGSKHSSESFNSDGSYTKKTSSSSVKAGVSFDPSGAVDLLEKLTREDAPAE